MSELMIALQEEIGDPGFFVGREAELGSFLKWTELSKLKRAKSRAILARRKKGKTALVQRTLYGLFLKTNPMLISVVAVARIMYSDGQKLTSYEES